MFLFIFESIGTSELILICVVALIFLGPRKLPQIAKTIGKTMAEFRNATNEFKQTWEREVNFEEEANALRTGEIPDATPPEPVARENSILPPAPAAAIAAPEIKQIDKEQFEQIRAAAPEPSADAAPEQSEAGSDKRSWL